VIVVSSVIPAEAKRGQIKSAEHRERLAHVPRGRDLGRRRAQGRRIKIVSVAGNSGVGQALWHCAPRLSRRAPRSLRVFCASHLETIARLDASALRLEPHAFALHAV
jgi:hypothetical protein